MTSSSEEQAFKLNGFLIIPSNDEVIYNNTVEKIEPKVMQVLVYLAENSDRIIATEELLEKLWANTVVTPISAQRCISILRSVFKKCTEDKNYISTFSKKGYQLRVKPVYLAKEEKKKRIIQISCIVTIGLVLCALFYLLSSQSLSQPVPEIITPADQSDYYVSAHPKRDINAYIEKKEIGYELSIGDRESERWVIFNIPKSYGAMAVDWSPSGDQLLVMWYYPETYINVFDINLDDKTVSHVNEVLVDADHRYVDASFADESNVIGIRTPRDDYNHKVINISIDDGIISSLSPHEYVKSAKIKNGILALTQRDMGQSHVRLYDTRKKQNIHTITTADLVNNITWMRHQNSVIYMTNHGAKKLSLDGNVTAIFYPYQGQIDSLSSSFDDQTLYAVNYQELPEVWEQKHSSCCSEKIIGGAGRNTSAQYSHDGQAIAFISDRSGIPQLWIHQHGQSRQATHYNTEYDLGEIVWSNDDEWISYKKNNDIYTYSVIMKNSKSLVTDELYVRPIGFSEDNREFFYINHNKPKHKVWKINIKDSTKTNLDIKNITDITASNGRLYYTDKYHRTLNLYHENGTDLEISKEVENFRILGSNATHIFYFIQERGIRNVIWQYNIISGERSIFKERNSYRGKVTSISNTFDTLYEDSLPEKRHVQMQQIK